MKKILMTVPYFLLWLLYVCLTMEERTRYMMAQEKGMDCIDSWDSSWFIMGSEKTYRFDRRGKPTRRYSTWREFWTQRGYFKTN